MNSQFLYQTSEPSVRDVVKGTLFGDAGVGKTMYHTAMMKEKYIHRRGYTNSITIDLLFKEVILFNEKYKLQLWDLVGARFRKIERIHVKNCNFAFYCFSIIDRDSLENITKVWIHKVKEKVVDEKITPILIGFHPSYKENYTRQVSVEEAFEFARIQLNGAIYFEVNCRAEVKIGFAPMWYMVLESMLCDASKLIPNQSDNENGFGGRHVVWGA